MFNNYDEMMNLAVKICKENSGYESMSYALMWDLYTENIPNDAIKYRNDLVAYIKLLKYNHSISNDVENVVNFFKDKKIENAEERAVIREINRLYQINKTCTYDKLLKLESAYLNAQEKWREAFRKNDYSIYVDYLKELFRAIEDTLIDRSTDKSPMQQLISRNEIDLTVEEIDNLFDELKEGLLELHNKIKDKKCIIDDSVLDLPLKKFELKKLCTSLADIIGFDSSRGMYGEALHPMAIPVGPDDVRILNKYENFKVSVFSLLHEAGHAIYTQMHDKKIEYTGLWKGHFGSMHEGQARFFENIIGRSKEMWISIYPKIKSELKEFENVSLEEFVKMINKVDSIPIRVDADEVTYSLHIIIRYEIEKEIFDGKLSIDDLPKRWNEKYKKYLGIDIKSDREGILQDPHWALGCIGYFQDYAIGNIYCGQFFWKIKKDIPDVMQSISKGNFEPMLKWLKTNIYSYSGIYTPSEIIKNVTGEKLSSKYYLQYLNEKYSELYNLN